MNAFKTVLARLYLDDRRLDSDLSKLKKSLQPMVDAAKNIAKQVFDWARDVEGQLTPSEEMCRLTGTVLDKPAKLMYDMGMDERWKGFLKEYASE